MSVKLDVPFNIDFLVLDEKTTALMRPVTSLDTFVGASKNFNPDGLYSNEIFGVVGTEARMSRFSYVDLRVPIIHPTIYKLLIQLRQFYKDIMSAKEFAKWDPDLNEFVKCDMLEGRTGYQFFIEHFQKLTIPTNQSVGRQQASALFEKYKSRCLISKVVVIPAGLRDIEVDNTGRTSSDAINELYYKLIAISNTINAASVSVSLESYNQQRVSFQNTVLEIYESISKIVEGKKNLFMGKWAGRKIFNGTRNVITAMNTTSEEFGHPKNVRFNDTLVGLYQTCKGLLPVTQFQMRQGFLDRVFSSVGAPAILTDPKTRQSVSVQLRATSYTEWMSNEGIEKQLTYFKEESIRHEPIKVEDYYLGLCYRGPDGTFALINGIDQLPEGRSAEDCTPITLTELIYCALYPVANNYAVYVTRYPITGIGSVYPSYCHLKTTIQAEVRKPLNVDNWEVDESLPPAYEFPVLGSSFYNSLSPHSSKLKRLGADFDGDTCSANFVYTDEALQEVKDFFNSMKAYVGTDGRFINDTNVDIVSHVLRNITGPRKYELTPAAPQPATESYSAPHAVIVTGNPKYINNPKIAPLAQEFYDSVRQILEAGGYQVSFDAGEEETIPDEKAAVWVAHSRGVDRLQYAPASVKPLELKTQLGRTPYAKSYDGVGLNPEHYQLSSEDIAALKALGQAVTQD